MFKACRDQDLINAEWLGTARHKLEYIEAWKYSNLEFCTNENFRFGSLDDAQVDDWLSCTNKYAPPKVSSHAGVLQGRIRLLLCERADFLPSFGMSKESFVQTETAFGLHPATLQAIFQTEGVWFKTVRYTPGSRNVEQVNIIIKAAQKVDIANYALSLSYDLSARLTTAILVGHGVVSSSPLYHYTDVRADDPTLKSFEASQSTQMMTLIGAAASSWAHPMLLPIILFQNHSFRAEAFKRYLDESVLKLEHSVGVAFPHHNTSDDSSPFAENSRSRLYGYTKEMHANMVQILFLTHVYQWASDCSAFLLNTFDEMVNLIPLNSSGLSEQSSREMRDALEYTALSTKNIQDSVRTLKERAQSQLEVVYSFTAQYDAQISSKVAIYTSRDSTAMKTLAALSAVFLPLNYVASLLSMTMFTWQQDSGSTGPASSSRSTIFVSSYFWVYWVISIPLTVIVIWIWRKWWLHEVGNLKEELDEVEKSKDRLQMGTNDGKDGGVRLSLRAKGKFLFRL